MSYFKTCPRCGAHLDPGEVCDCRMGKAYDLLVKLSDEQLERIMQEWEKEEAAQGATNTQDGKVEHGLAANVSTSTIAENAEVCKL